MGYKHFESKEELALHLFETCHRRVWTTCAAALASTQRFDEQLDAYIGRWLELVDTHPEVLAFLADSARVLWQKSNVTVVGAGDMKGQAAQVFKHLQAALEAAGAKFSDVVKMNTFVTDMDKAPAVREVRAR